MKLQEPGKDTLKLQQLRMRVMTVEPFRDLVMALVELSANNGMPADWLLDAATLVHDVEVRRRYNIIQNSSYDKPGPKPTCGDSDDCGGPQAQE